MRDQQVGCLADVHTVDLKLVQIQISDLSSQCDRWRAMVRQVKTSLSSLTSPPPQHEASAAALARTSEEFNVCISVAVGIVGVRDVKVQRDILARAAKDGLENVDRKILAEVG